MERLPLYSSVDDLDFLNQLGAPEYFGEEHSALEGAVLPLPEAEKPSGKQLEDLWRAFRELPTERQEKIRKLDQQISGMEPAKRDRTQRLLETYAAWLERNPLGADAGQATRRHTRNTHQTVDRRPSHDATAKTRQLDRHRESGADREMAHR
jgi:hypothetical protein